MTREQIKNLVRQEDYLICADSGYRHCVQLGFSPQLVLGDFDSYAGVVQSDCELLRYPIEKDDTDTMLAVKQALQRGYERLLLVGMLGGRLDHTLANIQTLVYAVEHGRQHRSSTAAAISPSSREDRQRRFRISRDFIFRYSATATVQAECASAMQSMSWGSAAHQRFSHRGQQFLLEGQPTDFSQAGILVILSTGGD